MKTRLIMLVLAVPILLAPPALAQKGGKWQFVAEDAAGKPAAIPADAVAKIKAILDAFAALKAGHAVTGISVAPAPSGGETISVSTARQPAYATIGLTPDGPIYSGDTVNGPAPVSAGYVRAGIAGPLTIPGLHVVEGGDIWAPASQASSPLVDSAIAATGGRRR
jgi:hypothetical protein